jgi:hypothetical protein
MPESAIQFLKQHADQEVTLSGHGLEVQCVKFFQPDELAEDFTILDTCDYHLNHGEFFEDPELSYWITSVDLIKEDCDDYYEADGLLIWFPFLRCFGSSDTDHQLIYIFKDVRFEKIIHNFGAFINTQWLPDASENILLMPWKEQGFQVDFRQFLKEA